jgi:transcription antitermination factor NusG
VTTWNIIKVQTLRESTVAGNLRQALGLKTYVPVEIVKMPRRGFVFERRRPLVPSYVFVKGAGDIPLQVIKRSAPYAVDFLEVGDRPATVTDAEIELIDAAAIEERKKREEWRAFNVGDRVSFKSGPFASMESLLSFVDEKRRTGTVAVPLLGSPRAITVPLDDLEKIA